MKLHIQYGYTDVEGKQSTRVTVQNNGRKVSATFYSPFEYETKESIERFVKRIESSVNKLVELTEKPLEDLLENK